MLALVATLVVIGLSEAVDKGGSPGYLQAREAFTQASLYLEERLPDKNLTYENPEDRPSLSLSILAGLTGELALMYQHQQVYKPLDLLQETLPYLWRNYTSVSSAIRDNLQDALLNVYPVLALIDSLCSGEDDVTKCNALVDQGVKERPEIYQEKAELLMKIGHTSASLNAVRPELDNILNGNMELPQLIGHRNDDKMITFVKELADIHSALQCASEARQAKH